MYVKDFKFRFRKRNNKTTSYANGVMYIRMQRTKELLMGTSSQGERYRASWNVRDKEELKTERNRRKENKSTSTGANRNRLRCK